MGLTIKKQNQSVFETSTVCETVVLFRTLWHVSFQNVGQNPPRTKPPWTKPPRTKPPQTKPPHFFAWVGQNPPSK